MQYQYYTYIMASGSGTLYIGITNHLIRRVSEHREGKIEGFTKKYNCHKLVYYEYTPYIYNALTREKELKHFLRKEKEELIKSMNPRWTDLYEDLLL